MIKLLAFVSFYLAFVLICNGQDCVPRSSLSPVYYETSTRTSGGSGLFINTKSIGKPGKRGPIGPAGSKGEKGDGGSKGDKGAGCENCQRDLHNLQMKLNRAYCRLSSLENTFTRMSNGYEYHASKTTGLTYAQAQAYCAKLDSSLAHIGMRVPVIRREIESSDVMPTSKHYWIGLTDIASEGNFVWEDGMPLSADESNWILTEPNNSGNNEDCVELQGHVNYTWNDRNCEATIKQSALCERKNYC